jgi:hypothetical protein
LSAASRLAEQFGVVHPHDEEGVPRTALFHHDEEGTVEKETSGHG